MSKGQAYVELEAMKMVMSLKASWSHRLEVLLGVAQNERDRGRIF